MFQIVGTRPRSLLVLAGQVLLVEALTLLALWLLGAWFGAS